MRLLDLDRLKQENFNGKTAIMRFLDKYERENPLEEIVVREEDDYDVILRMKEKAV